ncbi:MAG: hypothetical protein COW04_06350 [Deltaproteobacteria bacterium CG12_big_fil_rev_8_21_14_0_65_43_10]|nr:MAG: hypothetical protein AUK23_08080 [Deltaproteobacteria bacterium CG2_30_43_15]PIQ45667.1 MAG: hypothetical protein COW04_06350 [Deltaproteobacteria bacterium CG12_big_fil_rev_8_21_14_0_65_43_10]PIU85441.1 MAG: hypothetical protein COS67_07830 [Deltaproteobacteria bacterium CG06_land_8_20_14_3_00_44_19]PIX26460.1 MAG: hypothetical protein COZ68_01120 [Deltaproteobacteria bacterium CG_4_8_14_3_um_filter_43_13]PIZ18505.1 MAG: hypothetical protein COY50_14960 [Deltaproteobacteria bacterium C
MKNYLWWVKYIFLIFVILGFLALGINLLISSYYMKNTHEFVMLFFSSSFIILICISLVVGVISRMIYKIGNRKS